MFCRRIIKRDKFKRVDKIVANDMLASDDDDAHRHTFQERERDAYAPDDDVRIISSLRNNKLDEIIVNRARHIFAVMVCDGEERAHGAPGVASVASACNALQVCARAASGYLLRRLST